MGEELVIGSTFMRSSLIISLKQHTHLPSSFIFLSLLWFYILPGKRGRERE
jgi:hypothetical protein